MALQCYMGQQKGSCWREKETGQLFWIGDRRVALFACCLEDTAKLTCLGTC